MRLKTSRNAIFGYIFARKKLRDIARKLHEQCRIDCESPHRELAKLKLWRNKFHKICDHLAGMHLSDEFEVAVVLIGAKL